MSCSSKLSPASAAELMNHPCFAWYFGQRSRNLRVLDTDQILRTPAHKNNFTIVNSPIEFIGTAHLGTTISGK